MFELSTRADERRARQPSPRMADAERDALVDAVLAIRLAEPEATATQVHQKLVLQERFADTTRSAVKRTCSKVVKQGLLEAPAARANVAGGGAEAGAAPPTPPLRAETTITTRAQAATRVACGLPALDAGEPLFKDDPTMCRIFKEYVDLVDAFTSSLNPREARALPWDGFHVEVALLLLGLKPSVLMMHGRSASFADRLATHVFKPWLAAMHPPPKSPLLIRKIERTCAHVPECSFQGAWVLYATGHPQRIEIDAAFFGPPTLQYHRRDKVQYQMIGRALGYPSRGRTGDCSIAYIKPGFAHLENVDDDDEVLDYEIDVDPNHPNKIEGLRELREAIGHFLFCRQQCAMVWGLVDFQFSMGGRCLGTKELEEVARWEKTAGGYRTRWRDDAESILLLFWDQVNRLNDCDRGWR